MGLPGIQWLVRIWEGCVGFLYKYTLSIFIILFAIIAYILLLHVNALQSRLISAAVSSRANMNTLLQTSRYTLHSTFVILLISFGIFLTILVLVVRQLRKMVQQLRDYADQTERSNEKLRREVEERQRLAKELIKTNRKQWKIAFFDTLTGLPNRQLFEDRIEKSIAHAKRAQQYLALLYLDLDGFKTINDTLGHGSGDSLLKEIADRLKSGIRAMDTVARLGGDEFVVIVTEVKDTDSIIRVAERILQKIAAPMILKGIEVFVTASIGIVVYPDDATDVEVLVKNADLAMYKAKESGRNNYQFYNEKMLKHAEKHLALITEINAALNSGEFVAYYQPQINVGDNSIMGLEALARWQHAKHGLVFPLEFIETMEKNGLIGKVGDVILERACEEYAQWRKNGLAPMTLSVNFSVWQLFQHHIVDHVGNILAKYNVDPKEFAIEIKESALIKDIEKLRDVLVRFRKTGIRVIMDNFGAGYSSLTALHTLPIDAIKIANMFTQQMACDESCVTIMRSMIELTKQLKIDLVVVGVETVEQKDELAHMGCKYMQGFYWGEPEPAEQCMKRLFKGKS
jgi:diguanylate cyclase (GGDEF)-like protein